MLRLWLRFTRYCESLRFRKHWRSIYCCAVPIEADDNIFLSVCSREYKQATAECFARVWQRIPKRFRDELRANWKRLQVSWDGRSTSIPLHFPVIAVGSQGEMLAALGTIIGTAIRTQSRHDSEHSMDAVQRFFSSTILHLRHASDDPTGGNDQAEIAQDIAHYYLCLKRKAMHAHYFLPFTSEASDLNGLLREWGFDVERNNAEF